MTARNRGLQIKQPETSLQMDGGFKTMQLATGTTQDKIIGWAVEGEGETFFEIFCYFTLQM